MMEIDTKSLLDEATKSQQALIDRMAAIEGEKAKLDEERQLAMQEILRLDGEIRLLKRVNGKGEGEPEKKDG